MFSYPLALQKVRKERILYGFLGIVLAAATALSGFGYVRNREKDDWRGATRYLLSIPETNRLIIFISRMGEPVFDYYAERFPSRRAGVTKMALPVRNRGKRQSTAVRTECG